jgi:DNA-binding IclR family transcriptional regulator
MGRKPPTANMIAILSAHKEPMTWRQIQAEVDIHGAVLIGILNRMIERGLVAKDDELYRPRDC